MRWIKKINTMVAAAPGTVAVYRDPSDKSKWFFPVVAWGAWVETDGTGTCEDATGPLVYEGDAALCCPGFSPFFLGVVIGGRFFYPEGHTEDGTIPEDCRSEAESEEEAALFADAAKEGKPV